MTEERGANTWTRTFCGVGFLLILAGAIPSFLAIYPEVPWFALIILGIVGFTFGLTFEDADENEVDRTNSQEQSGGTEAESVPSSETM